MDASLSARRAWIETVHPHKSNQFAGVALRKESVDRNTMTIIICIVSKVALRKESVDRNNRRLPLTRFFRVALRKESVDRNY